MGRLLGFAFWSLLIWGSDFGVTVCIVFSILLWSIALEDLRVFLGLIVVGIYYLDQLMFNVCTRCFLLANIQ
jgi:hypothetical protein